MTSGRAPLGFTLIELLVVVAIIFMLASILMAAFADARAKARFATILQELRSIETAAELAAGTYTCTDLSDGTVFSSEYPCDARGGNMPLKTDNATPIDSLPAWPEPPCSGWEYDWENWDYGETIRLSVRRPESGGYDGSTALYLCLHTSGDCHSTDGANILDFQPQAITCRE